MIHLLVWNLVGAGLALCIAPGLARLARGRATALSLLWVVLLLADGVLMRHPVWAARLFPVDDLLYRLNVMLPLALLLMATTLPHLRMRSRLARGLVAVVVLAAASATHRFWWSPRAQASTRVVSVGEPVLQTSAETCVPATLLNLARAHGAVDRTEQQVALLAETRAGRGTPLLGALRAGRVLLEATGRTVQLERIEWDALLRADLPLVAEVALGAGIDAPAGALREAHERSWIPGAHHVVLLERIDREAERVVLIDPDVGRERWSIEGFRSLWTGVVLTTESKA